jgi:hypothetical protein
MQGAYHGFIGKVTFKKFEEKLTWELVYFGEARPLTA